MLAVAARWRRRYDSTAGSRPRSTPREGAGCACARSYVSELLASARESEAIPLRGERTGPRASRTRTSSPRRVALSRVFDRGANRGLRCQSSRRPSLRSARARARIAGDADDWRSASSTAARPRVLVSGARCSSMYKRVANPRGTGEDTRGRHVGAHPTADGTNGNDSDESVASSCQLGGHRVAAK